METRSRNRCTLIPEVSLTRSSLLAISTNHNNNESCRAHDFAQIDLLGHTASELTLFYGCEKSTSVQYVLDASPCIQAFECRQFLDTRLNLTENQKLPSPKLVKLTLRCDSNCGSILNDIWQLIVTTSASTSIKQVSIFMVLFRSVESSAL